MHITCCAHLKMVVDLGGSFCPLLHREDVKMPVRTLPSSFLMLLAIWGVLVPSLSHPQPNPCRMVRIFSAGTTLLWNCLLYHATYNLNDNHYNTEVYICLELFYNNSLKELHVPLLDLQLGKEQVPMNLCYSRIAFTKLVDSQGQSTWWTLWTLWTSLIALNRGFYLFKKALTNLLP